MAGSLCLATLLRLVRRKLSIMNKLSQLSENFSNDSIIIIDIPIGLELTSPNRICDIEARKFLGTRSSTIFSPPCLEAIFCQNYNQAKAINLTNTGKSISKQSWFLSKKILEAREFSEKSFTLKEGHPECSFAEFEGKPLTDKKKSTRGLFKRVHILEQLGFRPPLLAEMLPENTRNTLQTTYWMPQFYVGWQANFIMEKVKNFLAQKHQVENATMTCLFIFNTA